MLLNWQVVSEVYESVISGRHSLEDADLWATSILSAYDAGTLRFEPEKDETDLWKAAKFLFGIDMKVAPGEYLHSIEQVAQEYEKNWRPKTA